MSRKLYTRTCADCGKVVHNAGPNMQRCPECARRHDLALRREQGAHERELKNRRKMEDLPKNAAVRSTPMPLPQSRLGSATASIC